MKARITLTSRRCDEMQDGFAHAQIHVLQLDLNQPLVMPELCLRNKPDARARSNHFAHRLTSLGLDRGQVSIKPLF